MANLVPAADSAPAADLAPAADSAPFSESTPAVDSAPAVKIVSTDVTKALEAEASSSQPPPAKTELSVKEKYQLVRSIGEECIQEDELRNLLAKKPNPIAYDGFEHSGRMHIAQGVMKVINVNKFAAAGCTVKIWIADWFAELNNKMGGDMKKIQTVGKYFIEIWKAAGMQLENVQFLWSSEEINNNAKEYWMLVTKIAKANTLPRIVREYNSFDGLGEDYVSGALHPSDLKPALAKAINEILQPVRNHFETDSVAKGLLKAVKSYKVTK